MKTFKATQAGLSLVEILVALVISLFLLGGIVQVYVGNKATYRFSNSSSRVQENGRFALEAITSDLRMAGFWGCYSLRPDDNNDGRLSDNNPAFVNHLNFVPGAQFDFIDQPRISATNTDGDWTQADSLTVRGVQSGQGTFTADLGPVSQGENEQGQPAPFYIGEVEIAAGSSFNVGDIMIVTNCFSANIFQVSNVNDENTLFSRDIEGDSPGNKDIKIVDALPNKGYGPGTASVYRLQETIYSIGVSGSGSNEPALFRSNNGTNRELIEGIENFQVLFGIDTDNSFSVNQYVELDDVPNLNDIVSVRVWIVVRSAQDFVLDTPQTYSINGINFVAPDRRLRQVFSTTVAFRSKAG